MDVCVYVTALSDETDQGPDSSLNDSMHGDLVTVEKANDVDCPEKHKSHYSHTHTSYFLRCCLDQ